MSILFDTKQVRTFKEIGLAIREFRRRRDMSQEFLAEIIDCTPSHLSRIETGDKTPSVEMLDKIFSALGITIEILDKKEIQHETKSEALSGGV